MDLSLIANLENSIAGKKFLQDQESRYLNEDSNLRAAQKVADNLMLLQKRKPMVIEYYESKGKTKSIEMYINPQRLSVQTQKVKNKQYTRGGIFYHHWGDDHWSMQLSGTVGLAGMKGIEQLEQIYYYSGTLLKYTNVGPDKVYSGSDYGLAKLNYQSPPDILNYVLNVNDTNTISQILGNMQKINNNETIQVLRSNRSNSQKVAALIKIYANIIFSARYTAAYSDIYIDLNNYINQLNAKGDATLFNDIYQQAQKKVAAKFSNYEPQLQILIAYDLSKALFNQDDATTAINASMNLTSSMSSNAQNQISRVRIDEFKRQLEETRTYNEKAKINSRNVSYGWEDIQDELNDEWRPRQIFIYFEDRVYIGHFDSFQWARVAENPLIQYDMRFTIIRQILTTSNVKDAKVNLNASRYPTGIR